jgi:hypothetical protein
MSKFQDAMRRVITGDNAEGESVIIIDGGPSSKKGNPDLGEMFEIWEDAAFGPLTPKMNEDRGATRPVLGPRKGNFQVPLVRNPSPTGKRNHAAARCFHARTVCRILRRGSHHRSEATPRNA